MCLSVITPTFPLKSLEVSPRSKKVATPESSLGPGQGVNSGEPTEKLVPNTVKLSDINILCETISESNADNLADDAITDTEDKVSKVVETFHPALLNHFQCFTDPQNHCLVDVWSCLVVSGACLVVSDACLVVSSGVNV